jgi:hypothetical protein
MDKQMSIHNVRPIKNKTESKDLLSKEVKVVKNSILQDLERRIDNQPGTEHAFFYFTFSDAKKRSYKGSRR